MNRPMLLVPVALALIAAPVLYAVEAPAASHPELDLVGQVMGIIDDHYVEPVDNQKLVDSALSGMLNGLDPHSSYMTQQAYDEMKVQTRGEYGGLGIEITEQNNMVKVISPIDDTPAARAGLKPGDLIGGIDHEPVTDFTLPEIVKRLRGPVGSSVTLTVQRGGTEPFEVKLTRAEIQIKSVKSHMEDGDVGYVRISSFIENTGDELQQAMQALDKQSGGKLRGLVLDLRNDPGGLVDQAVTVADDFLTGGEIVSIRGRQPDDVQSYKAKSGDLAHGVPMVVLINGGSASASEIVAGALHDDHRAILLGTKSFGKGSVQTIIPLPGHGALRLTTARYYTPSGRSIQAEGITPDIEIEPARIEKVAVASLTHEADLPHALKNPDDEAKAAQHAAPSAPPPVQPQPGNVPPGTTPATKPSAEVVAPVIGTADDYQLARAVDLLKGLSLFNSRTTGPDIAGRSPG